MLHYALSNPDDDSSLASAEQLRAIAETFERDGVILLRDARVFLHAQAWQGDLHGRAEEVVQEALVIALRKAHLLDISRPTIAWLRRIVFNAARSSKRNRSTERKYVIPTTEATAEARHEGGSDMVADDELLGRLGAHSTGPEEETLDALVSEQLLEIVEPRHRDILRLTYIEQLSAREIAAALGINEGAVYTRQSRARDALRAALATRPQEEGHHA